LDPPLPILKELRSFVTFFPSHFGHSIVLEEESTSFSNTFPQDPHSYSKIGMTTRI
jgi:hypothetical protein